VLLELLVEELENAEETDAERLLNELAYAFGAINCVILFKNCDMIPLILLSWELFKGA
jgi:hypothetical protein